MFAGTNTVQNCHVKGLLAVTLTQTTQYLALEEEEEDEERKFWVVILVAVTLSVVSVGSWALFQRGRVNIHTLSVAMVMGRAPKGDGQLSEVPSVLAAQADMAQVLLTTYLLTYLLLTTY